MKRFIISALACWLAEPSFAAEQCSAQKTQQILAKDDGEVSVKIDCSVTLPSNSMVTKNLIFSGSQASGVVFDCNGGKIEQQGESDNVQIRSVLKNGVWQRPENITLKNCNIAGSLRISGMDNDHLRDTMRVNGATSIAQAAAPRNIMLDSLTIEGDGRVPLYLRPGVTYVTLKNSTIKGDVASVAVYLDAESAHNTLINNVFKTYNNREMLAIDGSAHNVIANNRFNNLNHGGVFIYRNCGERGVIRQQMPTDNVIRNNDFANGKASWIQTVVWVGSRNGRKFSYCSEDNGYPFGSSADNHDFARNNIVVDNRFTHYLKGITVRVNDIGNYVSGNRGK